jgi:hypothetical protein
MRSTAHGEVAQELVKAAREQLELVRDLKIAASIGETPDKAQPKRAPFWRSNLTAPSISANLASIAAVAGADGIGAALPKDKAWAAGQLTFELQQVEAVLARVAASTPWADLATDAPANGDIRYTLILLGDVRALLETDYPDALGLITDPPARMATDRRSLKTLAALGARCPSRRWPGRPAAGLVAARMIGSDAFSVAILDQSGTVLFSEELDARAHDIAISPDRATAVVFARRPGWFALAIDLAGRRRIAASPRPRPPLLRPRPVFPPMAGSSCDRERLGGRARRARGLRRRRRLPADRRVRQRRHRPARGDADVRRADDRVGNGGIVTNPDFDRVKPQPRDDGPSLAYVDALDRQSSERVVLPPSLHQLSIRHMAEAGDGSIWFGGQYEGPGTDPVDLVGRHRRGESATLVAAPRAAYGGMRQYVGAMAVSGDGQRVVQRRARSAGR